MMSRFLVKPGHAFACSTSVSLLVLAVVLWQAVGYLRRRAIVHIQISHGSFSVVVLQDAPRVPSSVALNRDHSIVYAVYRCTPHPTAERLPISIIILTRAGWIE
ncbi:hypothetical protein BDN67DRAFT_13682 [Paxillus ammoniavirescens]|nr:hypothetical protein BDN67DRAFT_13682 [Paxillus ammoniavirescens]